MIVFEKPHRMAQSAVMLFTIAVISFVPPRICDGAATSSTQAGAVPQMIRGPRFKIETSAIGMHRVTYNDLAEHLSKLGAPETWSLWCAGKQIPIYVKTENGQFGENDYIEWYAEPVRSPYNRVTRGVFDNSTKMTVWDAYTTQGVYYLRSTPADVQPLLHIQEAPTTVILRQRFWDSRVFRRTIRIEPDLIRRNFRPDADAEFTDGKFWDSFSWPSLPFRHHYYHLPGLVADSDDPVTMTVKLWGQNKPSNPSEHQARLSINQHVIGVVRWPGVRECYFTTTTLSPSIFKEWGTEFIFEPVPRADDTPDMMLVDWAEVTYPSVYRAYNNVLEFRGPPIPDDMPEPYNGWLNPLALETFTSEPIAVLNRTTNRIQHLRTARHWKIQNTPFYNAFLPLAQPGDQYVAYSPGGVRKPTAIRWVEADRLHEWKNGAEYIVITHEKFIEQARRLAEHRNHLGLSSFVTTTEEIADAFNQGFPGIDSIKRFLQHAYEHWNPRPRFVVLIGDASWDDLGVQGAEFANYIPTFYYQSAISYYASDNWYARLDGDDILPDVAIGRIPVRSVAEARAYVDKVIEYDTKPAPGDWMKSVYLLSSYTRVGHRGLEDLEKSVFKNYNVTKCLTDAEMLKSDTMPSTVTTQFDQGHVVVVFAGHGGSFVWQVGGNPGGGRALDLFGPKQVANLTNKGKYPLVFALTCYTNSFDNPMTQTIGESLILEPDKGAIACISASWRGYLENEFPFATDTLVELTQRPELTLGEAFMQAKHIGSKRPENVHGICLLGDPGLRIYIEPRANNLP